MPINSEINMSSFAPNGLKGLEWVSKYGSIGMNALNINDVDEGMNERGLTCEILVMYEMKYPPIISNKIIII